MKRFVVMIGVLATLAGSLSAQQAPPPPTNLHAESPLDLEAHVLLKWTSPPAPLFFKVYRSTPDSLHFGVIGVSQVTTFDDRSVDPDSQYYYYVTSVAWGDSFLVESDPSNIAGVTVAPGSPGPKGVIRGQITEEGTGIPLQDIRVRFFQLAIPPANWNYVVATDSLGFYEARLDAGLYLVRADALSFTAFPPSHIGEWYDDAGAIESATPVVIAENDTIPVGFALTKSPAPAFVYVSGKVTDNLGNPLSGAQVSFVRSIQDLHSTAVVSRIIPGIGPEAVVLPGIGYTRGVVWTGFTNAQGQFYAQLVQGREYIGMAWKQGYLPEMYDNTVDPTQAALILAETDTAGIDFSLIPVTPTGTTLRGKVTEPGGDDVPSRIILFPRPKEPPDRPARFAHTDSTGEFAVEEVAPGTYTAMAVPYSDYAPGFYSSSPNASPVTWQTADSVVVDGLTPFVQINLQRLAVVGLTRISGVVTSSTAVPLPGVRVLAKAQDGRIIGYGLTDALGNYFIDAVLTGPVTLVVDRILYNVLQTAVVIPPNTYTYPNVNFTLAVVTGVDSPADVPATTELLQNFPNPFNPSTVIPFSLSGTGRVRLEVFDLLGRRVGILVDEVLPAGQHRVEFQGRGLASGMYVVRLAAGGQMQMRSMILSR